MPARTFLSAPARLLLAATVVALMTGVARADEVAPGSGPRLEWAGAELLPVSVNAGSVPSWAPSPSRFRAGLGGTLRLLRLRWTKVYWTPIEAGVFVSGGGSGPDGTVWLHVSTEGGVRMPLGSGTFELGLAAGIGGLGVEYDPSQCDGGCAIGGAGLMLSPVARYLVVPDGGRWSLGFVVRAAVPLTGYHDEWLGHTEGFGTLILGGVDIAFGS